MQFLGDPGGYATVVIWLRIKGLAKSSYRSKREFLFSFFKLSPRLLPAWLVSGRTVFRTVFSVTRVGRSVPGFPVRLPTWGQRVGAGRQQRDVLGTGHWSPI